MVKSFSRLAVFLLVVSLVAVAGLMACTPTPIPQPTVTINSPPDGAELSADDVTVSISISDFNIVQKLGASPVSGEGHIHYYRDAEPPTTPGQPAVTEQGTYAATTETSHTWENMEPGTHTFSVQLVNNNHTPLEPPIIDKVIITVIPSVIEEESRHSGYGDRTGLALLQVITPHQAVITVEDGDVTEAIIDGKWDMIKQMMLGATLGVKIESPADGATLTAGDIKVSVDVTNFSLVDKLGQEAVPGEGHIHFYMDVEVPTKPGEPAVSAIGTYAVGTATFHTWRLVEPGAYTFSVQLVNNNHTPLESPVIDTVKVTIEPKQFSLVPGWYRNRQVEYYDFGANTPLVDSKVLTAPIYVFVFGTKSDGSPDFVPDQHNVIDVIPGDPGYSDLWQVNLVTVPSDYQVDSLKAVSEIMEKGLTITATDILVNCPIVSAGSMLETDKELTQGWYKGKAVYYFDFGANPDIAAPIYALITGMDAQGNPQFVQGQKNIIDVVPGDDGYSAFWRVNLVTVPQDYVADTLRSAADVVDSEYTMNETDILVNCPVVSVAGESVTINLSARNVAFDKSRITVPPGAMVTIVFTNNDSGIPYNFALYETQTANKSIYVGEIINGIRTIEYTFVAPTAPGTYFFLCDVHPGIMTGDFIVGEQEASSEGNGGDSSDGDDSRGY